MEQDVLRFADVISTRVKDQIQEQIMCMWRQRNNEMLAKMAELANLYRMDGEAAGVSTTDGDATGLPTSAGGGAGGASTSAGGAATDTSTTVVPAVGASTSAPSSPFSKISEDPSFYDDIPQFDLLKLGEVDNEVTGKESLTPAATTTSTADPTIEASDMKKPGSSTVDKKNRRKRAAINLNQGKKQKRLKVDEESKMAYKKYLSKRILKKQPINSEESREERPPFVQIAGFHVNYDDFYKSFKQRGEIDNKVMALWTYQFNIEEEEACAKDSNIVKKYAFSPVLTDKLIIEPDKFIGDSCNKEMTRLNKTWMLAKMDMLFFPIVHQGHWVLICLNMFLKQVCWFNSINASKDTECFGSAKNLVTNFSKACIQAGILKTDVSEFEWKYPTDYLQQSTLHDCGLYTMLYIESWNGKKMDTRFEPHMIGDYRKVAAGVLLLSPSNEISPTEFLEKYCNQEKK